MRQQAKRQAVLAAIRRREWLLQMLALGAAGCRRGGDRAYARGHEFHFTALTGSGSWETSALYVQAQLRDLGVRMDLQPLEPGALRNRLKAREFEAAVCGQWIVGAVDGVPLERFFGEQSPTGYRNPQLTRLVERLRTTADPEAVDQARREITDLLRRDQPVAILFCPAYPIVVHRRVKGLSSPWRADPLRFTDDLWLEDQPQQ